MFNGMPEPLQPVHDQHGREIGTVQRRWLGRGAGAFWHTLSLDGCDLGMHREREDAQEAVQDDWEAGRATPAHPVRGSGRCWDTLLA